MKIFIDESGSFGWNPNGVSLFCALTVADRVLPELIERFTAWKRGFAPSAKLPEIKGKNVPPINQTSFVSSVVHPCQDFWLTIVGVDTRLYSQSTVEAFKSRSVELMEATSRWAQRGGKAFLAMEFTQVAGWLRKRSPENYLAMLSLEEVIRLGVQHSIIRFAEPQDDAEFENIEILIDRSFIKEQAHLQAWKACLRNFLYDKSRSEPLVTLREWRQRNHPFNRKYHSSGAALDMSDLFQNHLQFGDSKTSDGLQICRPLRQY